MTIRGWWIRRKRRRGVDAPPFYGMRDNNVYYTGVDETDHKIFHSFCRVNFRHGVDLGRHDPFYGFVEVREWLHHNAGARVEYADPMFGEYAVAFRDPNDAFAFRMRFAGALVSQLPDDSLTLALDRLLLKRHGVAEFPD